MTNNKTQTSNLKPQTINALIWDLGNVLIDWDPRYVYRTIFDDEEKMKWFFETVCTSEWNEMQDEGRSLEEATETLVKEHPDYEQEIRAFYGRWEEMLGGAIHGTVEIFSEIRSTNKYRHYALTNWSAETFPIALERYEFLKWFDGIVMSGEEKMRKPYPAFYQLLLQRYHLKASEALFIDDNLRNIRAAEEMGIHVIHFQSPDQLRSALKEFGIETSN
jgi:2-haloacid dehalogenase